MTTTLRLPDKRSEYLKAKAEEIGVSQNALIMMFLDMGIRAYEGQGCEAKEIAAFVLELQRPQGATLCEKKFSLSDALDAAIDKTAAAAQRFLDECSQSEIEADPE